ncbi:hypothetical protein EV401DRAFT_2073912 [Pisolithus croceorrhizus]|nr:hypothetical protein EV401DRAFT_2073912 [Pisolithus croceorrhizus]
MAGDGLSFQEINMVKSVWNLPNAPLMKSSRISAKRRADSVIGGRSQIHVASTRPQTLSSANHLHLSHPSKPRGLTDSFWITWDYEWEPYLSNTDTNHKESPEITQELADAVKIPCGTIVTFSPGDLGVGEKLRLASTRNTMVEGKLHTLTGTFGSDIRPHEDEGASTLGHILEEILT